MTAEEAIKTLEVAKAEAEWNYPLDYAIAIEMAIEALELYDKLKDEMAKRNMTVEHIIEYMKFEDECIEKGFTFKSLIEAREKQIPKKPYKDNENGVYEKDYCPTCNRSLFPNDHHCRCGQAIDWSEEE